MLSKNLHRFRNGGKKFILLLAVQVFVLSFNAYSDPGDQKEYPGMEALVDKLIREMWAARSGLHPVAPQANCAGTIAEHESVNFRSESESGSCKKARGSTGALVLMVDGKVSYISKKIEPLKMQIQHYSVQKHLPQATNNFEYANVNELVIPEIANAIDMKGLVPNTHEYCIFVEEKKGKCSWEKRNISECDQPDQKGLSKYAAIDFVSGARPLAGKGDSKTAEKVLREMMRPTEIVGKGSTKTIVTEEMAQRNRADITNAALFSLLIGNIDLHPENVLIGGDGRIHLIDFGLTMLTKNTSHKNPIFSKLGNEKLDPDTLRLFKEKISTLDIVEFMTRYQSYNIGKRSMEKERENKVLDQIQQAFESRKEYILSMPDHCTFQQAMAALKNRKWTPQTRSPQYMVDGELVEPPRSKQ